MIVSKKEWNDSFKELKMLLKNTMANYRKIIELSIELHDFLHESVTPGKHKLFTLEDEFWQKDSLATQFSEKKKYSAAWHLWHSARIEDITCSHFILQTDEILYSSDFIKKMNISFHHTGNSMSLLEMKEFNTKINLDELRKYRKEVSKKTTEALNELTPEKLDSKVQPSSLAAILKTGSVVEVDSWLLDYWGKKRISGIITMPFTRHLLVHLSSALRII